MKNKKFFILIILLVIGFASISATLIINGNTKVAANLDDFNVIFIEGFLNGETNEDVVISGDKKTLTFTTNKLTNINDTARVDYKVKNISTQYDGDVTINCTNEVNNYVNVISSFDGNNLPLATSINMQAQEVKSGIINAELTKATTEDQEVKITCKIEVSATSRTNYAYSLVFDSDGGTNIPYKIVKFNSTYGELATPEKDGYTFIGWFNDEDVKVSESTIFDTKGNKTLTAKWKEKCQYDVGQQWEYLFTGDEQELLVPCDGEYKFETWGAQGGYGYYDRKGYGGYSVGITKLNKDSNLYINVGGKGNSVHVAANVNVPGGYNGGGDGDCIYDSRNGNICSGASGGGATHIATVSGELYTLESYKDSGEILIVSGGGGGTSGYHINGWVTTFGGGYHSGGGYVTNAATASNSGGGRVSDSGASQTSGWAFGRANPDANNGGGSGGGGGWYGGGSHPMLGTGGTGYIGNSKLSNKAMYCYNCPTSNEESTKTISTSCTSPPPTANCSKQGDGYAIITYLGE